MQVQTRARHGHNYEHGHVGTRIHAPSNEIIPSSRFLVAQDIISFPAIGMDSRSGGWTKACTTVGSSPSNLVDTLSPIATKVFVEVETACRAAIVTSFNIFIVNCLDWLPACFPDNTTVFVIASANESKSPLRNDLAAVSKLLLIGRCFGAFRVIGLESKNFNSVSTSATLLQYASYWFAVEP